MPAGPAAKLIVDAPGFVPLGADDVQAAHLGHLATFLFHLVASFDFLNGFLPFHLRHVQERGIFILQVRPGQCLRVCRGRPYWSRW